MDRITICCVLLTLLIPKGRAQTDGEADVAVTTPKGRTFEAFYPRGEVLGASRAAHSHGSFYKHRNPALVDTKNAAAYGFRFDGKRRFNYD